MVFNLKLSYQQRLFLLLFGLSFVFVVCFVAFQYNREKQYKVDKLNSQLQLYNTHLMDKLESDTLAYNEILNSLAMPIPELRVSVISTDGKLLFDNTLDTLPAENHLNRHEIKQAIEYGSGYTIRRHSRSTQNVYFYSATKCGNLIVRSALPYTVSLHGILRTDRSFLWFMAVITVVIAIIGYFATHRLSNTIVRLNRFAEKAEKGERICDVETFPNDELGSISTNIIKLYTRLQQMMFERDREHRNAMHEQLEKTRIKKQLTNNINHELKTPVASIKVCLETVLNHRDLPEEKHWEFIERCYENTERLSNLLNDISAITRMDDGAANIEKERVIINDVVDFVAENVEEPLHNAHMSLIINLPANIVVNGNRNYLSSIFRNLIDNAIAYSGGNLITLQFESESENYYTFSVADNGVGIPAQHLDRVFERFYRIDKGRSRLIGGTGLGLSIVRNAVELHGGKIYAENQPTGGVKFVFTLHK